MWTCNKHDFLQFDCLTPAFMKGPSLSYTVWHECFHIHLDNFQHKTFSVGLRDWRASHSLVTQHLSPLLPFPGSSRCRRPRACAGFCSPAGPLRDWCTTASDTGSDGHTGRHKHKVNAAVPQTSEGSNNKSIYSGSEIRDTVTANIFFYLPFLQSYRILCDCMTDRHFWISTLNFFFHLRV